jgi:hypothetical protein
MLEVTNRSDIVIDPFLAPFDTHRQVFAAA